MRRVEPKVRYADGPSADECRLGPFPHRLGNSPLFGAWIGAGFGGEMSYARSGQVARRRGTAARRSKHDSQALLVAILTLGGTGVAIYDLMLLTI